MSNETICIISGSTLGNAEYIAANINDKLEELGKTTILFHGPSLEEIVEFNKFIIVCSTHGEGELPDNLQPLIYAIREDIKQSLDYPKLKLLLIGVGDSNYDLFCNSANIIEEAFSQHNVKPLVPSLRLDSADLDIDLEEEGAKYILENLKRL